MKQIFYLAIIGLSIVSCKKHNDAEAGKNDIIYVETNNYQDNQNAVLAYRDKGDGKLEQLEGSPFLTNGAGVGNTASVQTLELKNSGPAYPGPGGASFKTSEPFSLAFSTNEKILYVVNQHTNKDFSIGNFNYLHALTISGDGRLAENTEPIQLPVANTIRPKGSAVVNR